MPNVNSRENKINRLFNIQRNMRNNVVSKQRFINIIKNMIAGNIIPYSEVIKSYFPLTHTNINMTQLHKNYSRNITIYNGYNNKQNVSNKHISEYHHNSVLYMLGLFNSDIFSRDLLSKINILMNGDYIRIHEYLASQLANRQPGNRQINIVNQEIVNLFLNYYRNVEALDVNNKYIIIPCLNELFPEYGY